MNDMTTGPFLKLALPTPLRQLFDYLPPEGIDLSLLKPGVRVKLPFQSRTIIGILIEISPITHVPREKLKRAISILDEQPLLPQEVRQLCEWAAGYYHHALGETFAAALPAALRKGKELPAHSNLPRTPSMHLHANEQPFQLNPDQQQAVAEIAAAKNTFRVLLLEGVTGSGKTEVYFQAIEKVLEQGQQALILVPEIGLTPQTIARVQARFSVPIAAMHSGLTESVKLKAWVAAKSGEIKILIGTRSAVFTPFAHLGLIIVDEEHDASYKQQERFRYHGRDTAIMRARLHHIPIVLGSATPSLESLCNAERGRYQRVSLPERAGNASLPACQVIDLCAAEEQVKEGFSKTLLTTMATHLHQGNQVMLFLNRRGFAPVLYCTQCAWVPTCRRCDTRLVYHTHPAHLRCHLCGSQRQPPRCCEQCKQATLLPVGVGTQRLEQSLAATFPTIPIIRIDRDSTRGKDGLQTLLADIHTQKAAILIGTQMLAKGHHFPRVTLAAVVDADGGLFSADFRATEHLGQLLIQVAGRAGREEQPGFVMIQTRHPQHPLLQTLLQLGYPAFARQLLAERAQTCLPPYSHLAIFRAEAYQEEPITRFLNSIKNIEENREGITLLGPLPAATAKQKGLHCYHLLIQSTLRSRLQDFLKKALTHLTELPAKRPAVKWSLDVDPLYIL